MAFTSSYTDKLIQQSQFFYGTPLVQPDLSGSFSGSFQGDGTNLNLASNTTIPTQNPFPLTASSAAIISRSIASGDIDSTALRLFGSGSISESGIFEVEGSAGPLFSVADGLDGVLMEVNNISGLPLFQVSSSNEVFVNRGNLTSGVNTATASFAMFSGSFQGNASQLTNISPSSITSGTFVTNSETGSFVTNSQTGSFVTNSQTGSFVTNSQTSSMTVATASYVGVGTTSGLVPFTTAGGKLTTESGFEYNTTTNQLTVDSLNVRHLTSSFITASRVHTSGSNIFGDDTTDTQTLIGTTIITGSAQITGSTRLSGELKVFGSSPTTSSLKIDNSGNFYHLGFYDGGSTAFANNSTNVVIGNDIADDGDYYNTIIGYQSQVASSGHANVIIGVQAVTNGNIDHSVAIGATAQTNNDGDISIGSDAGDTANSKGINIGRYAQGEGDKGIVLNTSGLTVAPTEANSFSVFTHGAQPVFQVVATGSSILTGSKFTIEKSGSTVFEVIGSEGTLFSIDDDLDGTIFTANDRSGLPVLEVSASGEVYIGKAPQSLYTTAVISSTTANVSQSLVALSTSSYGGVFVDYTANSGSNARAGSIVSVWNGSSINFTETTTLDIGDTSNLLMQVAISQSQAQVQSYATTAGYNIKTIIRSI